MIKERCNFFRKLIYFFQKIIKNTKQILKIPFFLKMRLVICLVWHIFFPDFIFYNFNLKKIIFWNLVNSWKVHRTPVTVTVTVIVTVTVSFEVPRWNVGPSIYIGTPKKIGGKKVNVKFFTVAPYFGVIFFTGLSESGENSTYCQIWPPGGATWWTKSSDMLVHWVKTIWAKVGGISPSKCPTIICSEKN